MPINPARMSSPEVARVLNSTRFGTVVSQNRVYRDFNRVGYRIAAADDPRSIHLVRYIAYLVDRHNEPPEAPARTYEEHRDAARQRQAELSLAGRDIGELPDVEDPDRKERCRTDFKAFCENYFPEVFTLEWSQDHLKAIKKIETAVLKGGLFALAMSRGSGKALALDTPLATPSGWTTMGDVRPGDTLYDERGRPCRVLAKSPVFKDHDCYKVVFNDGAEVVCDADHLWTVEDIYRRKNPCTQTTRLLAEHYAVGNRGWKESRFRIPLQKPLQCQPSALPIEPYALGVWLGDGTSDSAEATLFDSDVPELSRNILMAPGMECLVPKAREKSRRAIRCRLSGRDSGLATANPCFNARLRAMGLLNGKRIPSVYLRASEEDRLAVLQGLMDTDGHCDRGGHAEICIKSPALADGFEELLSSLGFRFARTSKTVMLGGKECGPYSRFYINAFRDQGLFRLSRKQNRMRKRPTLRNTEHGLPCHTPCDIRTIVSIEPVPSVPTQCVVVDSPSHLYLAGRRMVPTHNSSLTESGCVWSMLYGHRPFVVLIGATEGAALEMLDSIKTELEVNEHIAADFPEATYPIAALDGIANRCAGQLYHGERTRITWTADEIVLPTIEGAASSGVAVRVAGITGRIRGMKFKKPDGRTIRPSLVIVDDPQTTESAGSLEQTRKRVRVLAGDILGLAGPGKKIAGVMPCTVIRPGDMADEILDKVKHPEWQGERMKLVYKFPTDEKLWEKYADLRAEQLRKDGTFTKATAFYKKNRAAMDAGAIVGWPARFNYDEISAVQNAMNLKLTDEVAFWAEYQNEPLPEDLGSEEQLTVDAIIHKLDGHAQRSVPASCNRITVFIDVQKALLFYAVCAWDDDFTGYVIDYGAWPDQRRRYFSLADANPTLQSTFQHAGLEGQLYAGLEKLTEELLGREWLRRDGTPIKVERCLIDANWGDSTEVVYQFCRQTKWANIVLPSHGRYVGASGKPMSEYKKVAGDRVGFNWRVPTVAGRRAVRHVVFDANFWKSFVQSRLQTAMGDRGCLSLWGREPERHLLYAEHMTAEYKVRTEGRGRTVDEWKMRPEAHDNHWLDCTVGCAVAASMCGCVLPGTDNLRPRKDAKPRLKLSEIRKKKS